jgi:hypothetical protein
MTRNWLAESWSSEVTIPAVKPARGIVAFPPDYQSKSGLLEKDGDVRKNPERVPPARTPAIAESKTLSNLTSVKVSLAGIFPFALSLIPSCRSRYKVGLTRYSLIPDHQFLPSKSG